MANTDSKKKGNGFRINVMDFVVLLLVVICLVGAVIRIRQVNWFANDADLSQVEVYFSVSDIAYTSEDALVVGDTVTMCENGLVLGQLRSIDSILPSTLYVKDSDGNVLSVNYPESTRIDVTGTIQSLGKMGENGYLLGGTTYLAPGTSYSVQTEHMDFSIKILDIGNN